MVGCERNGCFTNGRTWSLNRSSQSVYSVRFAPAVGVLRMLAAEPSWLAVAEVIAPCMGTHGLAVGVRSVCTV